jgi:hypothetical protein
MPIARQLEPLTREYWATMHDWAHLHFFDQQTRRKRRRTVDEETGTIRIAIGIEDMVRIDLMAYAEGLHDELRTFMLANVDELFDEREPRLLPDFSLSTPDERRSLEEWHKSCVDDHPECFDKMWERIRIAEDLDAMRKLKKAATKSSPETEQTERETREPFSPLERDILECLKGKLLTRGELLAAMGRTGQYVQSLDRVIGPSSRLRKEGLVKKHSSGRGYYSVNEPPKESS